MTKDMSETSGVGAAPYILESLMRSGRTGCVISHIDQMTGCTPVRTELTKTSTGTPEIQEAG